MRMLRFALAIVVALIGGSAILAALSNEGTATVTADEFAQQASTVGSAHKFNTDEF